MISQKTELREGFMFKIKGTVAKNALAFIDASTSEVSATPVSHGGIAGISKGSTESGVTIISIATPETLYAVDADSLIGFASVAADVTAKKFVPIWLDTTANKLSATAVPMTSPVGSILDVIGNTYIIKLKSTVLAF